MALNSLQLIVNAYNASGINPQGFKNLTPEQSQKGLYLLNVILSDKTFDTSMLLYWEKLDGVFTPNVGQYFIERLVSIETLTFFLGDGSVRYPTQAKNLDAFMGSARAEGVASLPFTYFVNQKLGGADMYVYYLPNEAYPYQIWGQFLFESTTLFEDLSLKFNPAYIWYLTLCLARELCIDGNYSIPNGVMMKLAEYKKTIGLNGTVQDLGCKLMSSMNRRTGINWAQVNIGGAYTPGPYL